MHEEHEEEDGDGTYSSPNMLYAALSTCCLCYPSLPWSFPTFIICRPCLALRNLSRKLLPLALVKLLS